MKTPPRTSDFFQTLTASGSADRIAFALRRNIGFTLIEVLAVVAILALLAALPMPAIGKMVEKGNAAKCVSNLKQISVGVALAVADRDGVLPERLDNSSNPASVESYIYPRGKPANSVFHCPSADNSKTSSQGSSLGESYSGLSYGKNNAAFGLRISQIPNASKRMYAIESNTWNYWPDVPDQVKTRFAPRHRGTPTAANPLGEMAHVLFIDGHIESRVLSMNPIDTAEWRELGTSGAHSNMKQ